MTYSVGNLIEATDYNDFLGPGGTGTQLNGTWSDLYGQTALSQVSSASTVTATQWATLVNTISAVAAHQGTAITSRTAPTTGNVIAVLNDVQSDITNTRNNYLNAAALGAQYTAWTGTNSKTTATTWSPTSTITFTNTITWASSSAASYFWNCGGLVKIEWSKTSTGQTGDPEWNDLANTLCGDIYISAGTSQTIAGELYFGTKKVGGTGTPAVLLQTIGFYDLTVGSGASTVYRQNADSAPYTNNFISLTISRPTSTTFRLRSEWSASETDPISGGTAAVGAVPGTAPCTICTYFPPSTTYLTNSWGTPTITATVS
jgi:hypothetical protein